MAAVYKITSPSNRVYVGSTVNVTKRWNAYKNLNCRKQKMLFNSLKKHGVDKHKFEVITECSESEMFRLETHWGLFYNVLDNKSGLNLALPKDGEMGGYAKNRGVKKKGAGDFKKGFTPWNKGIPISEEAKIKMKAKLKGRKTWNKGKTFSEESKRKMSESSKGQVAWNKGKKTNMLTHNAKLVLCLNTGVFYYSSSQASNAYNYKRTTLQAMLNGQNPNTSNLIYV